MSEEPFLADLGDGPQDIMPLVLRAMAACPYRHDFSPAEVAELVVMRYRGKYINVGILDRIEGRRLEFLTGRVLRWVWSARRVGQIVGSGVTRFRPYVRFDDGGPDADPCAPACARRHRWLDLSELEPYPLPGCDRMICACGYDTYAARDLRTRPWLPGPDPRPRPSGTAPGVEN